GEIAGTLRTRPEEAPAALRTREEGRKELERLLKAERGAAGAAAVDVAALLARAATVDGVPVLATVLDAQEPSALLELVDRLRGKLGEAAIILGSASEGRAHVVVSLGQSVVARGLKAG